MLLVYVAHRGQRASGVVVDVEQARAAAAAANQRRDHALAGGRTFGAAQCAAGDERRYAEAQSGPAQEAASAQLTCYGSHTVLLRIGCAAGDLGKEHTPSSNKEPTSQTRAGQAATARKRPDRRRPLR